VSVKHFCDGCNAEMDPDGRAEQHGEVLLAGKKVAIDMTVGFSGELCNTCVSISIMALRGVMPTVNRLAGGATTRWSADGGTDAVEVCPLVVEAKE